jgi:hypothetical protein
VGHSYLDEICQALKDGDVNGDCTLNDNTGSYKLTPVFKRALNAIANEAGNFLNHDQIAALQIPSLSTYAWMSSYFDLMGDKAPNADEIHLEPIDIKDIYDEVISLLLILLK